MLPAVVRSADTALCPASAWDGLAAFSYQSRPFSFFAPMKTRFILLQTSHAGNVGAAARAMKTMGFGDLVLVAPRWPNVLRRDETIQRASGALDVLKNARVVATLDEALDGVSHLCATAMTPRDFGPPTSAPRAHFEALLKSELLAQAGLALEAKNTMNSPLLTAGGSADGQGAGAVAGGSARGAAGAAGASEASTAAAQAGIAFLFGSERFGMANDDVYRCHVALQIPTDPHFGSLNLGAAVQVIAYEWRQALGGFAAPAEAGRAVMAPAPGQQTAPVRADAAQVAGLLAHWQEALAAIGFLDPEAPKKLMPRLNQLCNRAQLLPEEVHILRGVAKAMLKAAAAASH